MINSVKHGDLIRVKSIKEMLQIGTLDDLDRIIFPGYEEKFDIHSMSSLCDREFYIAKVKEKDNKITFSVYDYDYIHADRFILILPMVEVIEEEDGDDE